MTLLKEIQQKTQNSLAKIILNQLSSLPREDNSQQVWLLDFTFLNNGRAESVKLEIEQHTHPENKQKKPAWKVKLTITPPKLGIIHCTISSFDQTINTCLWSESDAVISTIRQHANHLKDQFSSAGITLGHLSAQTRKPITESQILPSIQKLIDQKI